MRTMKLHTIVAAALLGVGLMWLLIAPPQEAVSLVKVMMAGASVVLIMTAFTHFARKSLAAHFATHVSRSEAFIWNAVDVVPSAPQK